MVPNASRRCRSSALTDVCDISRLSVFTVTRAPARSSAPNGCSAYDGAMPVCRFDVGATSRHTPDGHDLGQQLGILDDPHAVPEARRSLLQRVAHGLGPVALAGVQRQRHPALAQPGQHLGVHRRGVPGLRPGQVEPDHPAAEVAQRRVGGGADLVEVAASRRRSART